MIFDSRGHLEALGKLSRRALLGSAAVAVLASRAAAQQDATDTAAVLEAAACRILPSDDGPGAREAKVGRFIERQLAGELSGLRPAFEQLARLLDLHARRVFHVPFAALTQPDQDAVLGQLSRGALPARGFPQAELFRALHTLTLEGFLSDPAHGGNDGEIGWRAIGFAAPHLRKPGDPHGH
ncbi:MAG TPA: gluconate 2-dehydrogenase subunit 3 family protein [Myxococcales bacterium]|nr:gluconate 2-dehydrogenase subunit 3 family protein [Myxococcales bacterium]